MTVTGTCPNACLKALTSHSTPVRTACYRYAADAQVGAAKDSSGSTRVRRACRDRSFTARQLCLATRTAAAHPFADVHGGAGR